MTVVCAPSFCQGRRCLPSASSHTSVSPSQKSDVCGAAGAGAVVMARNVKGASDHSGIDRVRSGYQFRWLKSVAPDTATGTRAVPSLAISQP